MAMITGGGHVLNLAHAVENLRLFQHTFGTHPEQPLPTGYKPGFLCIVGERGIAWGVLYGCVVICLEKKIKKV